MEIDSRGSESTGYRPVRVKITNFPPTPATYDRQIRVTFGGMWNNGVYGRLSVSQVVEIPEGSVSGEALVSVVTELDFLRRIVARAYEHIVVFNQRDPFAVGRTVRVLAWAWAAATAT